MLVMQHPDVMSGKFVHPGPSNGCIGSSSQRCHLGRIDQLGLCLMDVNNILGIAELYHCCLIGPKCKRKGSRLRQLTPYIVDNCL